MKGSLLSADDFDLAWAKKIFGKAQSLKSTSGGNELSGKVVGLLFYEPSSRTATSFEAAAYRLGASVVKVDDFSKTSVTKGESFLDTIRTYASYVDVLVIRHPEAQAVLRASETVGIPVINAGNGSDEHPTQALLDLCTIWSKRGTLDDDDVFTFVGDLARGRTVHSLARVLEKTNVGQVNYVAWDTYQVTDEFMAQRKGLVGKQTRYAYQDWEEVLGSTTVLYMTRLQDEREHPEEPYMTTISTAPPALDARRMALLPEQALVLHPFPRRSEINPEIDTDSRVAYFDQMEMGMWVRAALLDHFT